MQKTGKKVLSWFLTMTMLLSMMPTMAFATETPDVIDSEAELSAALAVGGDVELGGDIELTNMVVVPEDVTAVLDLNGYDITVGYQTVDDTKHIYAIDNMGNLTIKDSSADGDGSITARGIYNGYNDGENYVTDAVLTIDGVEIVGQDWNGGACVWSYGGEVYLNDATMTGNTGVAYAKGYLEINDGTYTCYSGVKEDGTVMSGAYTYNVRSYGGLKITDGTFTSHHGVLYIGGGKAVVEDGSYTIQFAAPTTSNVVYIDGDSDVTIKGGEFLSDNTSGKADSGTAVLVTGSEPSLTIEDGTFVGMNGMVSVNENTVIKGGSFDTVFDYNHYGSIESAVAKGATITVAGEQLIKTENGLVEDLPDYVVLPNGVTEANYKEKFGDNTVTDGTNYYATLKAALEGIRPTGGNVLYCKPKADVGAMTHGHVCSDLTVYGNDAKLNLEGEQDFELDTYKFCHNGANTCEGLTDDVTLTVKYLHNSGAWGQRTTANKITLVFENCKDMSRIYFTGTSGEMDVTLTDCTFTSNEGGNCKVYTNANGRVTLTGCEFSEVDVPVNLNHKVSGTQTISISDCTFSDCGTAEYDYSAPVRVLSSVEGANSVLEISDCSFSDTVVNKQGQDADILLDYGVGVTVATVSDTEANLVTELAENVGTATAVGDTETKTVATGMIGEGTSAAPYQISSLDQLEMFRDAVNGGNAYSGKYIKLMDDIDLYGIEWTPIGNSTNQFKGYFDGNNKTISNLTVSDDTAADYAGLFGYVRGNGMSATATPSVKDLNLTNVSVSGDYYVGGLAGQAYVCNITNVSVQGEVSGVRYVGGIAGHVYTYFKDCTFTGKASCSFDALGGIAGAGDCRAYDCAVYADITGSNWVGGIVGNGQEGTSAVGCYVKGTVSSDENWYRGVGGIAGVAGHGYSGSEFRDNYFDGKVYLCGEKVDAIVVGIVNVDSNENINTVVEGNSWNTEYYDADTMVYVVGEVASDATAEDWVAGAAEELTTERNNNLVMLKSDLQYVDAETADEVSIMSFSEVTEAEVKDAVEANGELGGSGDTYEIGTLAQLKKFRTEVNNGYDYSGETIVLTADISLKGEWDPIGDGDRDGNDYVGNAFAGTFDGKGHTISGLTISGDEHDTVGLFGVVDGGKVMNLKLDDVDIDVTTKNAGAAIGLMVNNAEASNIEVLSGSVVAADGAGGVVGRMTVRGTIKDCANSASVTGAAAGGIVGKAYYTSKNSRAEMNIIDCTNDGTITGTANGGVGGIVGFSAANVSGCVNDGAVTTNGEIPANVGGIVGWQQMYGEITGNTNNANITTDATTTAGGIIGWVNYQYATDGSSSEYPKSEVITVTNNINNGTITAPKTQLGSGGIVGNVYNAAVVTGNTNKALRISGSTFAAGVVGAFQVSSANGYSDKIDVTVSENTTSTMLDKISANCTDLVCYANQKDGYTAEDNITPMVGTGTAEDPYLITSLIQLEMFRDDVNAGTTYAGKHVKLGVDVNLNNVEWAPIGNSTNNFRGTFDGNHKTISNLVITGNNSNVGLFGFTTNGEIKNLTVNNAKVSGRLNVGVVAGTPYTSKYTNISVTGHVEVNGMSYVGGVGGKNAYADWTDITVNVDADSYVKAVSTENGTAYRTYVGGVIGFMGEGNHTLKNIYCNINVIGDVCDVGGIVGIAHYDNNFENVTYAGNVTNTSADPKCASETGAIAGVWHNQAGYEVEFTDIKATGTISAPNAPEVVFENGGLIGAAYTASNDEDNTSGSLVIDGEKAWPLVAEVGGKEYGTLAAAVEAAQGGDTVTLLGDAIQELGILITDKNLTIDLNGESFTVTKGDDSTAYRNFLINGTSQVTIKNGTIISEGTTDGAKGTSSGVWGSVRTEGTAEVTMTDLKLYNYRGNGYNIKAYGGTTVNVSNTEVFAQYGGGVEAAGGTIELNDVTVNQTGLWTAPYNSMTISVNGGGKVIVNSGSYTTEPLAASDAYNQGSSHGSWAAGVLNSGGTLIINGGTFANGNYGEDELATAARGLLLADTGAAIEINGGTFQALKSIIDYQNNLGNAEKNPVVTIYGGTYSVAPEEKYIASGYALEENADGTYGVKAANEAWILRDGRPKYYSSLEEAIADAKSGETVMLAANVKVEDKITIDKDITVADYGSLSITFTGHTGFWLAEGEGIDFTLENVTLINDGMPHNGATHPQLIDVRANNSTVTLDGVTTSGGTHYVVNLRGVSNGTDVEIKDSELYGSNVLNIWGSDHEISIENSALTGTSLYNYRFAVVSFNSDSSNVSNNNVLKVDGDSTLTAKQSSDENYCFLVQAAESGNGLTLEIADGATLNPISEDDQIVRAVALGSNGKYYGSLAAAIDAAQAGDTVTLLQDVTPSEQVVIEKSLTLDLNGKTITGTEAVYRPVKVSGNNADIAVKIINGTIETKDVTTKPEQASALLVYDGADVTLENVELIGSQYGVMLAGYDDYEDGLKNNNITSLYVNDGTKITADNVAIIGQGAYPNTEIVINDGAEITSVNSVAIYHPQQGTITINGGTITGDTGIIVKAGNLVVKGGTISANGEANDHEFVSSGAVSTGDAIVVESLNYGGYGAPTVSIEDGQITSENGESVVSYAEENYEVVDDFIAGGSFAPAPDDALAIEGYEFTENADGTYGITEIYYVAQVNDTKYSDLQSALEAAVVGGDEVTVTLLDDINLTGETWTPVYFNSYSASGANTLVIDGADHTITGLSDMLFSGIWTGTKFEVKDLTIDGAEIRNDVEDADNKGVGAIVGNISAIKEVVLTNVKLTNSHVEGGHWTGGFFGYIAGYSGNDGPVFTTVTVTDCSITDSTIIGKGSVGGVVGHATGDAWTSFGVEDTAITGNTITSTGTSNNKAGIVMGTIGAAGTAQTTNGTTMTGGVSVSVTETDNDVKSNETEITTVYGRQGSTTGVLTVTGGTYENYPIEENVAYAAPAEGYEIVENVDGTYGLEVDPAYGKVAKIGDVYYDTLGEAVEAAGENGAITLLANITDEVTVSKVVTITKNGFTANIKVGEGFELAETADAYTVQLKAVADLEIDLTAIEVSFDSEILLRMFFIIPDELLNDDDAYAVVVKDGAYGPVETKITMAEFREEGPTAYGDYMVEQGVASPEMGRDVTVQFVDGNGNYVDIKDYVDQSVNTEVSRKAMDYATRIFEVGNDRQKALVAAMLTYGGYAQKNFMVDADAPVYSVLPDYGYVIPTLEDITHESISQELATSDTDIGITYSAQQAYLDSSIYHRVYFKLDSGASIDNYKFELTWIDAYGVEHTEVVATEYDSVYDEYYVDILDIAAPYLDYMYKIVVTNTESGDTYEVSTSVLVWAKLIMQKSTNTAQVNLAKAVYYYNQAANTFFGK